LRRRIVDLIVRIAIIKLLMSDLDRASFGPDNTEREVRLAVRTIRESRISL
jgi:hypothetical protein